MMRRRFAKLATVLSIVIPFFSATAFGEETTVQLLPPDVSSLSVGPKCTIPLMFTDHSAGRVRLFITLDYDSEVPRPLGKVGVVTGSKVYEDIGVLL